jgi:hypothetical protein
MSVYAYFMRQESMAPDYELLYSPGDFYLEPNVLQTEDVIDTFYSRDLAKDLANVCLHWYKKPPQAISPQLGMASNDGKQVLMTLSKLDLTGAW